MFSYVLFHLYNYSLSQPVHELLFYLQKAFVVPLCCSHWAWVQHCGGAGRSRVFSRLVCINFIYLLTPSWLLQLKMVFTGLLLHLGHLMQLWMLQSLLLCSKLYLPRSHAAL